MVLYVTIHLVDQLLQIRNTSTSSGMDSSGIIFRRGLITKLPDLNKLILTYNNLSTQNICNTVNEFVKIINSVAKPLFCRNRKYKDKASFKACKSTSKAWFDNECRIAKNNYMESLRNFNMDKCEDISNQLRQKKRTYKKIIARKKRVHKRVISKRLESLKHKKPRDILETVFKEEPWRK